MLFVERLGEAERVLRRETKPSVRFALQGGQVIQCAGERAGRLAFLGDDAGLAGAFVADGFGPGYFPEALGLQLGVRIFLLFVLIFGEGFVEPASGVFAALGLECPDDFPVSPRDELLNLLLALDENRERRRLHTAHGRELETAKLRVEGGHGARAVDAHEPVGLGTADGGIGERTDIRISAQIREAIADGGGRHGLQPETGDGLLGLGVLDDVAENEFALPPGVARGIHQAAALPEVSAPDSPVPVQPSGTMAATAPNLQISPPAPQTLPEADPGPAGKLLPHKSGPGESLASPAPRPR